MEELLTTEDVAKLRKCAEITLRKERISGSGIPFLKLGRSVRYRKVDVEAYLASRVRTSTSQTEAA